MAEKKLIDILVPWILCILTFGFFWVKLKLGKHLGRLIEWIKESFKSKKSGDENPHTYSYVDYD